ncbi:Structural maintenance of chromosomes protein 6, partial [Thoreauomyces humboldtii]
MYTQPSGNQQQQQQQQRRPQAQQNFRLAVICASNQNRSMEAHNVLLKAGFVVSSYGTGSAVRLPGPAADKPNIYPFGLPYNDMYQDLQKKDPVLYKNNGLLLMLDRNRRIKRAPERWQESRDVFDLVISCEERCFDSACDDLNNRSADLNRPVHLVNLEIQDNHQEAAIGGQLILQLVNMIAQSPDRDADLDRILEAFSARTKAQVLHTDILVPQVGLDLITSMSISEDDDGEFAASAQSTMLLHDPSVGTRKRSAPTTPLPQPHPKKHHASPQASASHSDSSQSDADDGIVFQPKPAGSQKVKDETGSIAHVELVNFMCHKYLAVPLGPKINFIVGHNGSGKSAILTALSVCLGARATLTNRATSLKDFLKEGTNIGSVTVTIRNGGADAYRPEEYGDAIIIERKIRREGSSTYKIKNASGVVVSTKREELLSIMDTMQIHAENPMTILTQDAARSFLANSTASDKYNFFLKGTGLRQLSYDYNLITQSVTNMKSTLDHKKTALPDMKKEYRKLEATLKNLEKTKDLQASIEHLKKQWVWSLVVESEDSLEQAVSKLQRARAKVTAAEEKKTDCETQIVERDAELEKIQTQIDTGVASATTLRDERKSLEQERMTIRQKRRTYESERLDMNATVLRLRRNMAGIQTKIDEEVRRIEGDGRTTRKQQLTAISDLEQRKLVAEGQLREVEKEYQRNEQEVADAHTAYQAVKRQQADMQSDFDEGLARINELRRGQSADRLGAFGNNVRRVVDMIEQFHQQGKWRGMKPIGPIGHSLNSFVVQNQEDMLLLQRQILSPCNCNVVRFARESIDFSHGEPDSQYLTVIRALEVSHPLAEQLLVINHNAEKTVLVKDRHEGHQVTAPRFPNNVSSVFTKDCFQVGNRGGGLSTQAATMYRGSPRLTTDVTALIREENERRDQLEPQIEEFARTMTGPAKRRWDEAKAQQHVLSNDRMRLRREVANRAQDITRMNEELLDEEDTNVIGSLREALARDDASIESVKSQYKALQAEEDKAMAADAPFEDQVNKIDGEARILKARIDSLGVTLEKTATAKAKACADLEHWNNQINTYTAQVAEAKENVQSIERTLAAKLESAEAFCPRVECHHSNAHVENECKKQTTRLKELQDEHGSYEDVEARLVIKKRAYLEAKSETDDLAAFIRIVGDSLRERLDNWGLFRAYISARARMLFGELMNRRGFAGRLLLDHNSGSLELRVTINSDGAVQSDREDDPRDKRASKGKDPRSLSGGEKSFSTVCLLLSLWESMGSPFRALDEFDVFMDAVNRRSSMTAMIDNAREQQRACQYIFITPQTMGNVPGLNGPDVRVHRLLDPERGQTRLDASEAD